MTMMMTSSLFGLEDMEAHLWGPSSPMADATGSAAFHPDQEDHRKGGQTSMDGVTSPVSPFSSSFLSSSSPHPFYTPPRSPPAVLQGKTEISSDPLPFPWLAHSGQLGDPEVVVSADSKEDVFGDLDWMAERVDLSDFDLDSLIGTSSPNEESPSDPDDLLASLDCPIELDSFPIPILSSLAPPSPDISHSPSVGSDPVISSAETASHGDACDVPSSPDSPTPEPQEELEMKSESTSADSPSPSSPYDDSSSSPAYTLDLGSEVDVPMDEVVATVIPPPVQRFVVSLSPTRIVLVLAPKNDASAHSTGPMRSNVNHSSPPASPQTRSSRTRPYPDPKQKYKPPLPTVKVKPFPGSDERETWKAPKNKKLKKMEQNKTAATRYRQKKRAEQDLLLTEYSLLERKNVELKEKAESMAREIEYLKELMEEVRLARLKSGH